MTKKIQDTNSMIKHLFLTVAVLFGVRLAFGCCGGWGEDTLHSLSYSPNLEIYVANISPSTGESGDMVWEWQVYDKDLKYKATIMFGDRGSSLFVPPDQSVPAGLKSVLDRTRLKVSSGCAQATKQEGTYSYNYWPQECLGTLNKIVTTELRLQALKASSDCGLHGVQKGRTGIDIVYRDPETKNDLIAETITSGGAIKSVKCYQQDTMVVVDARLSYGRCTPVERSNFFLFDKNKIGYLKDNIQGYRALQQKDFLTAKKYLTASVVANPSYNHSNFNLPVYFRCPVLRLRMERNTWKLFSNKQNIDGDTSRKFQPTAIWHFGEQIQRLMLGFRIIRIAKL